MRKDETLDRTWSERTGKHLIAPEGQSLAGGSPHVIGGDDDHTVGTWHRLLVVIWRKDTTIPAVKKLEERIRAHADAVGGPVGFFTVVEEGATLPSSEARALSADVLRRSPIILSALTFEGIGFRAAAIRGIVTGIGMLARPPYPHRAFATVAEAGAWVEERTEKDGDGRMSAVALVRAVSVLRRGGLLPVKR